MIVQFFWICILLLLVIFSLDNKYKEENSNLVIKLAITGIMVFLLIFEARARYLYLYIPIFIIGGSLGLKYLNDIVIKICGKYKKDGEKE